MVGNRKGGRIKKNLVNTYTFILTLKQEGHIIIVTVLISAMRHAVIAGIHNFLFPLVILPSAIRSVGYSSHLVG